MYRERTGELEGLLGAAREAIARGEAGARAEYERLLDEKWRVILGQGGESAEELRQLAAEHEALGSELERVNRLIAEATEVSESLERSRDLASRAAPYAPSTLLQEAFSAARPTAAEVAMSLQIVRRRLALLERALAAVGSEVAPGFDLRGLAASADDLGRRLRADDRQGLAWAVGTLSGMRAGVVRLCRTAEVTRARLQRKLEQTGALARRRIEELR